MPKTSLLQAHYQRRYNGVLMAHFPTAPHRSFNYTGTPPNNTFVTHGTRVVPLKFNTTVEVVLQETSIQCAESHPLHLHGYDFFIAGTGFDNFDASNDTTKYNLVDPVQRNTISVATAGWVAIRFIADNTGEMALPDALQGEENATKRATRVRKPSKRYSGPEWVV
ncbi:hypothetical protein GUJ93_ZPchr0216g11340 [Zizania palustris]|uniref:Plastocyanin-like domain-containing protein n=1 Tax=Zizania palustris TaxID=103762 RepID=A0A8J5RDF4_ZIZPA|nr:hypothetical protein GUJ93_ZPchr0216g11340 [Zizania palustris]